jgi:hypothetical protein
MLYLKLQKGYCVEWWDTCKKWRNSCHKVTYIYIYWCQDATFLKKFLGRTLSLLLIILLSSSTPTPHPHPHSECVCVEGDVILDSPCPSVCLFVGISCPENAFDTDEQTWRKYNLLSWVCTPYSNSNHFSKVIFILIIPLHFMYNIWVRVWFWEKIWVWVGSTISKSFITWV